MKTFKIEGVPEHYNLPWHLAQEEGAFERAGLSVYWTDQPGGTGAMTRALNEGELDMAVVLTEGMVADILKGGKGRILQYHIESPLRWGVHVPAGSSFEKVEDLEGARFAITRYGSGSHLMAYVIADRMGWDPNELEWVVVGGMDGAREALANDKADVYLCEQFTTQFLVDRNEFERVGAHDTPWSSFVIAARKDVAEEYPEQVRAILDVIDRTNAAFMERDDAVDLVTSRFDIRREPAGEWFKMTRWGTEPGIDPKSLDPVQNTLQELRLVQDKEDPEDLVLQMDAIQAK
jgi:sulfonate transport system substrate-binding protein